MKCKTPVLAALLTLALLLFRPLSASADMIYPAPYGVVAGSYLDHLVATVDSGALLSVNADSLPAGLAFVSEQGPEGVNVYLRGTPLSAGSYDCALSIGETPTLCHLDISPAVPSVSSTGSVSCYPGEAVQVAVVASSADGGTLSYQWYFNQSATNEYGYEITGETQPTYTVGTNYTGLSYYYCVVTNTNNGWSVSAASPVIAVSVEENSITSVTLQSAPYRLSYVIGESLDAAGLQLAVGYSSGNTQIVADGFTVAPAQFTTAGEQLVQVDYQGYSCSFTVTVQEQQEVVTGIGVLTLPNKIRYTAGEALDTTGLSIRAYTNLGARDVSNGFSCYPTAFDTLGTQTVSVFYENQVCTFDVSVEEAEHPVSLAVETMPARTTYAQGESLDITGLVLRQISSRQNTQYIYSGFTCTPIQLTTVGRQEITVTYGTLSARFTVTVTEAQPLVTPVLTPTPAPTAYPTVNPTTYPTAYPTAYPTPVPTAIPTTVPTAAPTTALSASPLPSAAAITRTTHSAHQANLGRSLIGVIISAAVLSLAVLGAYILILNKGGFEAAADSLRKLFRRRGGSHRK